MAKLPTRCECGLPTQQQAFTVLVKTLDPQVVEIKKIECSVCHECGYIYLSPKGKRYFDTMQIVGICKEMERILYGY